MSSLPWRTASTFQQSQRVQDMMETIAKSSITWWESDQWAGSRNSVNWTVLISSEIPARSRWGWWTGTRCFPDRWVFDICQRFWLHPLQSITFLSEQTLHGLKRNVYVLIKILKFCTGSSTKSYQCKYAINHILNNRHDITSGEVGKAIQEVIHYHTLRGKFSSIHPELRREGIDRVELGEEGLRFIRDTGVL